MSNQKLRIAIITSLYAPFLSGVSTGVHQRVCWLLKQGHHVLLMHPECNNKYPKKVGDRPMSGLSEAQVFPNFSSFAYPTEPLIFYKSLPQPLSYRHWSDTEVLKKFQPDIVVVEEAPQMRGFYSLFIQGYGRPIGSEYGKLTGTPIISLFHTDIVAYIKYYLGNQIFNLISPILPFTIKKFSELYDLNLFPSQEQLTRYQKLNSQRSEYLRCQGVDCQKFHPQNIIHNPIPDDDRQILLFVGRITAEKNVTQLLESFPHIVAKVPNAHLVIVGSGPLDAKMRQLAEKYKSGVTIWGESYGNELLGWYARADVFVNPSITENLCTSNNEALASGTPIVLAKSPSALEQVKPGVNGFLAEANNPIDFANKVITLLQNPELKAEMSQQARQSVLKFDWSACMQNFEDKLWQIYRSSHKINQ
ncbi:group 1 glycosyl transferase [Calothrix sp. NIES-4101]|nr:group 1 glycosyl transferase [Calothrix sp. NIES-4101]